jgi:hypothetical protein
VSQGVQMRLNQILSQVYQLFKAGDWFRGNQTFNELLENLQDLFGFERA